MEDVIVTIDRHVIPSDEALCVLLKRLAYPCRLGDMISRFGRPEPTLCIIFNHMLNLVYHRFRHLLDSFEQQLLSREKLTQYAEFIYDKSGALKNCREIVVDQKKCNVAYTMDIIEHMDWNTSRLHVQLEWLLTFLFKLKVDVMIRAYFFSQNYWIN